jgi:hypothetical protein
VKQYQFWSALYPSIVYRCVGESVRAVKPRAFRALRATLGSSAVTWTDVRVALYRRRVRGGLGLYRVEFRGAGWHVLVVASGGVEAKRVGGRMLLGMEFGGEWTDVRALRLWDASVPADAAAAAYDGGERDIPEWVREWWCEKEAVGEAACQCRWCRDERRRLCAIG